MPSPLAEATSGVIGSLCSMLAFYPLDVHKARVQSSTSPKSAASSPRQSPFKLLLRILTTYPTRAAIAPHYVGVQYKMLDTVASSFTFFFILTLLKREYKRLTNIESLNPTVNLMLSSLAAMANTTITLPLDGIVTRKQTSPSTPSSTKPPPSPWAGLEPALMLSSNPAIHYTAYDLIKSTIVTNRQQKTLNGFEAFLVGLIAKSVATIVTYPLIRTKQIMMSGNAEEAGMKETMTKIYDEEGIKSVYKGLLLQLGHTVCKAALLMSIREQISNFTRNRALLYLLRARQRAAREG
ncbi:hypothetical protein TrVE_jg5818 [Triparma verrucosa]|uniref:Ant protein n=1 Tax=Triparma verrucosa TaxID=1606542 RepID=A0A9W7FBX3_9STRA|nr:hypothetical protein TrVE_jg5818 [Triparma verrucosa]